ncbi:MAG: hypothetical protein HY999_03855 [Nitrospinae bacterium]|nr:hypothetical protein [Nitrospinota bacterium]
MKIYKIQIHALILCLLITLLYLLSFVREINGDGIGYIRRIEYNSWQTLFLPGHLIYCPFGLLLKNICSAIGIEAETHVILRVFNSVLGGIGVALFSLVIFRYVRSNFLAITTAFGLAISFGYWIQGIDVETYMSALFFIILCLYLLESKFMTQYLIGFILGVLHSLAVLFHLSNILFFPFMVISLFFRPLREGNPHADLVGIKRDENRITPPPRLPLFSYLFTFIVVTGSVYYYVMFQLMNICSLAEAWEWIFSSTHEFKDTTGPINLIKAFYGFARGIIYVDLIFTSNWGINIAKFVIITFMLFLFSLFLIKRGKDIVNHYRDILISLFIWIIPYLLFAIFFFSSDTERWVFILPPLWLIFALSITARKSDKQINLKQRCGIIIILIIIFGTNLVTTVYPMHRQDSRIKRSTFLARYIKDGDLIITPGHDQTDFIWLYNGIKCDVLELTYVVGGLKGEKNSIFEYMDREIYYKLTAGQRIFLIRIFDDPKNREMIYGWKEITPLGIRREDFVSYFSRYNYTPIAFYEKEGLTLWELLGPIPHISIYISNPVVAINSIIIPSFSL